MPPVSGTASLNPRLPFVAIGLVSVTAFLALLWLIYGNEGAANPGSVAFLPAVNASLNTLSSVFLVSGYVMIRKRRIAPHRTLMTSAFVTSSLFLVSYVIYHALHGDTPFQGQGIIRPIYFFILISHIVLSAVALPLVLSSFYLSLSGRLRMHAKVSRLTFPIWTYVSVTGVLVFFLLRAYG
ncbi:MAG: DUF420 domain-containing protein [Myxococcales bacterium]|nr:DUF420 domain-containing protein [Myxococcales bacterium]